LPVSVGSPTAAANSATAELRDQRAHPGPATGTGVSPNRTASADRLRRVQVRPRAGVGQQPGLGGVGGRPGRRAPARGPRPRVCRGWCWLPGSWSHSSRTVFESRVESVDIRLGKIRRSKVGWGGFETVAAQPPQPPPGRGTPPQPPPKLPRRSPPRRQPADCPDPPRSPSVAAPFHPRQSRSREAWSRHPLAGARCSTTGKLSHRQAPRNVLHPCEAASRPTARTHRGLPRRCAFPPTTSRSREAWSRHPLAGARCSTTGKLSHRQAPRNVLHPCEAASRPTARTPAASPRRCVFQPPDHPAAARRGLDTRSWRSLLDHQIPGHLRVISDAGDAGRRASVWA
jgi:hypothetical protein